MVNRFRWATLLSSWVETSLESAARSTKSPSSFMRKQKTIACSNLSGILRRTHSVWANPACRPERGWGNLSASRRDRIRSVSSLLRIRSASSPRRIRSSNLKIRSSRSRKIHRNNSRLHCQAACRAVFRSSAPVPRESRFIASPAYAEPKMAIPLPEVRASPRQANFAWPRQGKSPIWLRRRESPVWLRRWSYFSRRCA